MHERIQSSNCRACVTACPAGALSLDDDGLALDVAGCDGCGLCVGACPQDAITMSLPGEPRATTPVAATVALACDRAEAGRECISVPCVHALGWAALVRLYRRGARSFRLSCGDCERCTRAPAVRFELALARVNDLLASRGLPAVVLAYGKRTSPWPWRAPSRHSVDETRRTFLRRLVPVTNDDGAAVLGAAALLPDGGGASVQPHVPTIDPARCVGCDACARLCPAGAISLASDPDGACYRLRSPRCTGCGICVDVCEPGAITLGAWTTQWQQGIALYQARCPTCGITHHSPRLRDDRRCAVCARSAPQRRLFVVEDPDQSASPA